MTGHIKTLGLAEERRAQILAILLWIHIADGAVIAEDAKRNYVLDKQGKRPAPVVAIDNVCAWPNLTLLQDGTIIATIHNQPSHLKVPGDVECWASTDRGATWTRRGISAPRDDEKAARGMFAAGVANNGDLIVISTGHTDPVAPDRGKIVPTWVSRSQDGGKTWTIDKDRFPKGPGDQPLNPYGAILPGANGNLRVAAYDSNRTFVFTSRDDGVTWVEPALLSEEKPSDETALFHLGGGKWLAAARGTCLDLYASEDDAMTWRRRMKLTANAEIPGHISRINRGLLLSYGNRNSPQGVDVRFGDDDGTTWSEPFRVLDCEGDVGYPSSVQLPDGQVLTAYYAQRIAGHDRYHMGVVVWDPETTQKSTAASKAPESACRIGSRRELFVDDYLIDRLSGKAELRLHHPVAQEVALEHSEPWEGSGSVYHSIFKDGDRYRMYYAGGQLTVTSSGVNAGAHGQVCCYAESDDGIHWRKPALGLHEFQGSTANNIVMVRQKVGDATSEPGEPAVFKDENPDAPADAKYKALLPANRLPTDHRRGLLAFKSPDGLHWSPMSDTPIVTDGAFDSQNLAFWDATQGHYRAYWRYFTKGGYDSEKVWNPQGHRAIRTAWSKDFVNWEEQQDLRYVDSPSEQLYTNQVKPYHRAPHVLIGFPARYIERGHADGPDHEARDGVGPEGARRWSTSLRALPELEHRQWRARSSERYGRALTEGLFMASRDGVTFKRWNEGFLRPGIERQGTWNYGHQFIGWHAVETKGTLEGAPNELSLYAVESYWTDNSDLLRRYTLRLDGFVSVRAPMSGGDLVTKPLTFSGKSLRLNFATSAAGSLQVELQDETGNPLPGYALDDCEEMFGDTLDRSVNWKSNADLSALIDQTVRVRFVLRDADLYSMQFSD